MAALVRPSVLAKAWGIHPRTVTAWLRTGKLPAVKTPGEHYRVRAEDVVAFCAAEGLPMPAAASPRALTVLLAKRGNLDIRPLRRALRPLDVEVVVTMSGAGALLSVATSPPRALVLDALLPGMDVLDALVALAAAPTTARLPVFVCEAPKAKIASYLSAGARAVTGKGELTSLAPELARLAQP